MTLCPRWDNPDPDFAVDLYPMTGRREQRAFVRDAIRSVSRQGRRAMQPLHRRRKSAIRSKPWPVPDGPPILD